MGNIEKLWQSFRANVIAANASDIQLIEMRRAFYAGAASLMGICHAVGDDNVTEDEGEMILKNCEIELDIFSKLVEAGKA